MGRNWTSGESWPGRTAGGGCSMVHGMKKLLVFLVLAGLTCAATTASGGISTGNVSVTCSLGQCGNFYGWTCDGVVNLDSLTVTMDVPLGKNGKARDAVYL